MGRGEGDRAFTRAVARDFDMTPGGAGGGAVVAGGRVTPASGYGKVPCNVKGTGSVKVIASS